MVDKGELHTLLRDAADDIDALTDAAIKSGEMSLEQVEATIERRDRLREVSHEVLEDTISHSFDVGDYALDDTEPTASPEVNTVEVVELLDVRADEHTIEETGKTVAEHNQYYPSDDPVVVGIYPNMGGEDQRFHFPESRLRDV